MCKQIAYFTLAVSVIRQMPQKVALLRP